MNRFPRASFVAVLSLVSIGLVLAQESPPADLPAPAPLTPYQSLVAFEPDSETPFLVNPTVVKDLAAADDEAAMEQLRTIKQNITDLVTRHPSSPAAKEMREILDKAGLKVIEGHGVYPKDVFCITVPITR